MIVTLHGKSNVSLLLNEEEFNIVSQAMTLLQLAAIEAERDTAKMVKINDMVETLRHLS